MHELNILFGKFLFFNLIISLENFTYLFSQLNIECNSICADIQEIRDKSILMAYRFYF